MPSPRKTPEPAAPAGTRKRKVDWRQHGAGQNGGDSDRLKWASSGEGDHIRGRLTRVAEANTRFGVKCILELDDCINVVAGLEPQEDGDYLIWPTPGLIDALDTCEADEGDVIEIFLEKLIPSQYGNPFKAYTCKVISGETEDGGPF